MPRNVTPPAVGKLRRAFQFASRRSARAALIAARRRSIACLGVSPGRISDDGLTGTLPDASGGRSVWGATAETTATGTAAAIRATFEAADALGSSAWRSNLKRTLRRRTGLCPSSRLSHSRKASAEMSTPRPRNAMASTSTESPARRSRSSSSRCASSCVVFGCFGWRAFATNSASVGGGFGAMSWWAGGGEGVMWERYSERLRSAMGVVLDQSKPRGLDVGVLAFCFIWILADASSVRHGVLSGSESCFVRKSEFGTTVAVRCLGVIEPDHSSVNWVQVVRGEMKGLRC